MALPPSIQLVSVTFGPFVDFQGIALRGATTFDPSTPIRHEASGTPILNRPITIEWDADGMGAVILPATDSAGLNVSGFTYRVSHRTYEAGVPAPLGGSIALPAATPNVDLDLLVPIPASNGVVISLPAGVSSVAGLTGAPTADQLATALSTPLRAAYDSRDVPLTRTLPDTYVAGIDDIGPHIAAALAGLEGKGRASLTLPPGTHVWNTPQYLNAATRDLTYEIRGHGRGTVLQLGAGLDGKYAIHLNEDAAGTQGVSNPRHPRLIFADLFLTSTATATSPSLVWSNGATLTVENLRVKSIKELVHTTGYVDIMTFRKIHWETPLTGGCLYYNHGNGDGLVMEQITATADDLIADLDGCNGGVFTGLIGGRLRFANCDAIEIISPHVDTKGSGGDGQYATLPWCHIEDSRVSIRNGWDHIGPTAPMFEINDTGSVRHSEVLWDGYSFGFRPHLAAKTRAPHVLVTSAVPMTKLRFRRCTGRVLPEGSTNRYPVGPTLQATDPAIQAAFDAHPTAMLEDVDLVQSDLGWQVIAPPPLFGRSYVRIGTAPTVAPASTTITPGNLANGTYYYKVAIYTNKGRGLHTAASTEASAAITTTGQAMRLNVTARVSPALVRIWRGTTAGTYDRYADVPLAGYSGFVDDTGPALEGYPWITTSVPIPPTANTTMDGRVVGRQAIFQGAAAPTEGAWTTGDRIDRSAPTNGTGPSIVCTAGGTPGTWVDTPALGMTGGGMTAVTSVLAADVTVASSSTTPVDTSVTVSVTPGTYMLDAGVAYTSPATADLNVSWGVPAGTTGTWTPVGPATNATTGSAQGNWGPRTIGATAGIGGGDANAMMATPRGRIVVANAGNVTLRVAQNTADVGVTTLSAGSYLTLTKVA